MPSLFHIDFNLPKEYCEWINDLLKFATFLTVVHIFGLIAGKSKKSGEFFQNLLVTLIGLTFYHLIVKKIIKIIYKSDQEEGFTSTLRLFR
jgi:hypothetical protein